jgi:hypothetical protein
MKAATANTRTSFNPRNSLSLNHLRFLDLLNLLLFKLAAFFCQSKHNASKQNQKQQMLDVQLEAPATFATHVNIY